jgi:hypothetical protein
MVKERLKELCGKKFVWITRKGNDSIKISLEIAKKKGKTKVLVPDQGGWITYLQYPKDLGMDIIEIKTDSGLIDLSDLESKAGKECVFLCNSMPGYIAYEENMQKIADICKEKDVFLVNDATGTISNELAKVGDIIFGSFGRWKSINATFGGFIASDEDLGLEDFNLDEEQMKILEEKAANANVRVKGMVELCRKVKEELKEFDVIHREKDGFNVAVRFADEESKQKIIDYCKNKGYEYVVCPKYIRVNEDAVSIELKRLDIW